MKIKRMNEYERSQSILQVTPETKWKIDRSKGSDRMMMNVVKLEGDCNNQSEVKPVHAWTVLDVIDWFEFIGFVQHMRGWKECIDLLR